MESISPKVTILMPVYNGEKYLKKAIDSVIAQTFQDFEFLIINDGSTDNTQRIIELYTDSRILCHKQINQGVAKSLNNGLKLAKGTYIRRHDADDFSEPWMLAKQINFLKAHPEIPMVSTQCAFMTERGKVSLAHRQPKNKLFQKDSGYAIVGLEDFIPYSPIVHGTVLAKKSLFEEFNGYRTEFLTSEDNDLWLRILDKYPIAVLNSVAYYLRLSGTSATQVHKSSATHFRNLAIDFARERKEIGTDRLMRKGDMPAVTYQNDFDSVSDETISGKVLRHDILSFKYKVHLGAKDYKAVVEDITEALKSGWKLKQTYKNIAFPILGDPIVKMGVKVKKFLK